MSNFSQDPSQLGMQGVPQGIAQPQVPAQNQPQVGVEGSQQVPGDQQQPVNPNLPQVQELPEINPEQFSIDGLETVVDPRVADHIRRQHEANLQHHVARLQQVKDREIAQLRQQYQQLQRSYHQYAVEVDPSNADYLEQARIQAEQQEQVEALRQRAVQANRYEFIEGLVEQYQGVVRFEDLRDARGPGQAQALAAQIAAARQRVPQVPPNQMQAAGPSGGYAQPYDPAPVPGSKAYENVWAKRGGRDMPHKDQESIMAAMRWIQQNGG